MLSRLHNRRRTGMRRWSNRRKTEPEAMRLAARQWIFCEDIVSQGTQSIRGLAMEIYRSGHWVFWWD